MSGHDWSRLFDDLYCAARSCANKLQASMHPRRREVEPRAQFEALIAKVDELRPAFLELRGSETADTVRDDGSEQPETWQSTVRMGELVSSVRVVTLGGHDHVHVWNRGGKAGTLIVDAGEGTQVAARLLSEPTGKPGW